MSTAPDETTALAEPVGGSAGLSAPEVDDRRARGLTNAVPGRTSRPLSSILRANLLTPFNAIFTVCFVAVLWLGDLRDGLFYGIVVVNAAIGIVQEVRAKRELDRLAVLAAPHAVVRRSGTAQKVRLAEVVLDDILLLNPGDQVAADAQVLEETGLTSDESLLTGESDPTVKSAGDTVLSGSFIVAGTGSARVTAVGADSYAHRLTAEIKRVTQVNSELRQATNRIMVWLTWALLPLVAIILVGRVLAYGGWDELFEGDRFADAVVDSVASIVGIIPEGLVLLTSLAFAVASLTLARRKVLVQELAAVEVLARVDVLCLDKTGTLTTGEFELERIVGGASHDVAGVLACFASDEGANATARALAAAGGSEAGSVVERLPFSSAAKYSGITIDTTTGRSSWLLGAPDWLLAPGTPLRDEADAGAAAGHRALALVAVPGGLPPLDTPATQLQADHVAVVLLRERVRPEAAATLTFFAEQGVKVIVLSGDNPLTVRALAARLGVSGSSVDASALTTREDLALALTEHTVFGRVRPEQKRDAVAALQAAGHVVAMTGDGVNDALAIKDADLGIAMGDAAGATTSVARLVLLDNRFDRLPTVVALGRRVIANVERVANIFLSKTVYGIALAVIAAVTLWPFPFLPRQLSVVSGLAIGIPSFVLALTPNTRRYLPGVLSRIVRFSVPSGIIMAATSVAVFAVAHSITDLAEARTVTTIALFLVSLWLLCVLARPLTPARLALLGGVAAAFVGVCAIPWLADFFALQPEWGPALLIGLTGGVMGAGALELWYRFARHRGLVHDRLSASARGGSTAEE